MTASPSPATQAELDLMRSDNPTTVLGHVSLGSTPAGWEIKKLTFREFSKSMAGRESEDETVTAVGAP